MNPFAKDGVFGGLVGAIATGASVDAAYGLALTFGDWTIGTHRAGWRVLKEATLIAGRMDDRPPAAASAALNALPRGRLLGVEPASKFDLRLYLENKIMVEFFVLSPGETEICHILGPGNLYAELIVGGDWRIGSAGV